MTNNIKAEIANAYIEQNNKAKEESWFFDFLNFNKVFDLKDEEIREFLAWKWEDSSIKIEDVMTWKLNLLDNIFSNMKMNLVSMFDSELKQLKEFMDTNTNNTQTLQSLKEQIVSWIWIKLAIENALNPSYTNIYSTPESPANSTEINKLYNEISGDKPSLESFSYGMEGFNKLPNLKNKTYLTVVDYSKSKDKDRFYVINLSTKKVEYTVPVWHWKKSGWAFANSFSNANWSNKTSLWFYRTPDKITKANTKNRSGLLLNWIEDSNDNATSRWIFIHPGSVNWSEWCFTLPENAQEIMNKIKWDSLVFSYYPDETYLASSNLIDNSYRKNIA